MTPQDRASAPAKPLRRSGPGPWSVPKAPAGRDAALELIAQADALVEGLSFCRELFG